MSITVASIVLAAFCVTHAALCYWCLRQRKQLTRLERQFAKQSQILNGSIISIGNRVLRFEQRHTCSENDKPTDTSASSDHAYEKAKALIRQGLTDEVVSINSGISLSEIELIRLIHFNAHNTSNSQVPC